MPRNPTEYATELRRDMMLNLIKKNSLSHFSESEDGSYDEQGKRLHQHLARTEQQHQERRNPVVIVGLLLGSVRRGERPIKDDFSREVIDLSIF